jgi:hypothetical protein
MKALIENAKLEKEGDADEVIPIFFLFNHFQ